MHGRLAVHSSPQRPVDYRDSERGDEDECHSDRRASLSSDTAMECHGWNESRNKITLSKIFCPVRFNKRMNITALFFSSPASVKPAQHLNMFSVLVSHCNNTFPGPSHFIKLYDKVCRRPVVKLDSSCISSSGLHSMPHTSVRLSLNIIDILVQLRGSVWKAPDVNLLRALLNVCLYGSYTYRCPGLDRVFFII